MLNKTAIWFETRLFELNFALPCIADPHPDTAHHFDADPDSTFTMMRNHRQCCGTGTATYCINRNRNAFRFRTGFGVGFNIKCNKKVNKITNERPNFLETMLLLTLKRQDCVKIFLLLKNCAKNCLDPEPEPKLFQNRNWNRNHNKSIPTTLKSRSNHPTFHYDAKPDQDSSQWCKSATTALQTLHGSIGNLYSSSAFHLDADSASQNDADPESGPATGSTNLVNSHYSLC